LEKIEMKKTLVAVAAVAATTAAFAQVTIFGIVDQSITRTSTTHVTGNRLTDAQIRGFTLNTDGTRVNGTAAAGTTNTTSLAPAYTGNELGFKGSESIGDLTADFQIHFSPSVEQNGSPTSYQSHVGVKGAFGYVRVGKFFSPTFFNAATYNPVGLTAFGYDVASGIDSSFGLKSNMLEYTLPAFANGLSVTIANQYGETAGATTGNMTNWRINYATGPFSVGVSGATTKTSPSASTKDSTMGASYDMGMMKLMAYKTSSKGSTDTESATGQSLGVSIPLGALTLGLQSTSSKQKFSYYSSHANMVAATLTAGTTADKSTGMMLQAKYDLSKRTALIFQNGSTKVSSGDNAGYATKGTSLGLWHAF
jgi:predicted porin